MGSGSHALKVLCTLGIRRRLHHIASIVITAQPSVAPLLKCDIKMSEKQQGTFAVKAGLAQMLKGGVIMDVTNVEEARIAEEAGAVAVMALERVPADIRRYN
jgi:hypothetical protein